MVILRCVWLCVLYGHHKSLFVIVCPRDRCRYLSFQSTEVWGMDKLNPSENNKANKFERYHITGIKVSNKTYHGSSGFIQLSWILAHSQMKTLLIATRPSALKELMPTIKVLISLQKAESYWTLKVGQIGEEFSLEGFLMGRYSIQVLEKDSQW